MKALLIYRNHSIGYSIHRVFTVVQKELEKHIEVDTLELPAKHYNLSGFRQNIRAVKDAIQKGNYDVIHITGQDHYLIPFIRKTKVMVTVHDLGSLTNHFRSIKGFIKYFVWITPLKFAHLITCISSQTLKECIDSLPGIKNKCKVVYNPYAPEYIFSRKDIQTKPIVLHIGTNPNKNLRNTTLALKDFPCHLRIIGKLSQKDIDELRKNNIDYSNAHSLTDEEIVEEYNRCDLVNFPSFYEGFGMPIIEAQATGRPIITSNIPPMPEVGGDGAVYVNPESPESILQGYHYAMQHYNHLIEKGRENVKRFSAEKIAREYIQVYRDLVK